MEWYVHVLTNFTDFKSRARRKEYWMFVLFNLIVAFCIGVVATIVSGKDNANFIGNVYQVGVFIPSLAVAIRRLHDTDHSGWFILIPLYNLYLLIIEGTRGSNRFGADPKDLPVESHHPIS